MFCSLQHGTFKYVLKNVGNTGKVAGRTLVSTTNRDHHIFYLMYRVGPLQSVVPLKFLARHS